MASATRNRWVATLSLSAAAALAVACGSMAETVGESDPSEVSIPYSLPVTKYVKGGVKVTRSGTEYVVELKLDAETGADETSVRWLRLNHTWFSSDTADVTLGRDGFLTKISTSADPKTGETIGKAGDAAKSVVTTALRIGALLSKSTLAPASTAGVGALDELVAGGEQSFVVATSAMRRTSTRASDGPELTALETTIPLGKGGVTLRLSIPDAGAAAPSSSDAVSGTGVLFRVGVAVPVHAQVLLGGEPVGKEAVVNLAMVDVRTTHSIPLDRSFLVKRDFTLSFDKGVLTGVKAERPGELLAFLGLPITIAEKVVGVIDAAVPGSSSEGGGSAKSAGTGAKAPPAEE